MAMPHQAASSTGETGSAQSLALELQRWLIHTRAVVAGEIRSYPTPIPRCDAQFNHLIEQREHLSKLLTDLDVALDPRNGEAQLRIVLATLMDMPAFGESIEERDLRDRIGAELRRG
jgi:hypothetical protein